MTRTHLPLLLLLAMLLPGPAASQRPMIPFLEAPTPVPEAFGYLDPTFVPDGGAISMTGSGHRGLFRSDLADDTGPRRIVGDDQVFWRHDWSPDGTRIRVPPQRLKEGWQMDPDQGLREPLATPPVSVRRDDVYFGDHRLTQGEDRFFEPILSPDGRWVAFVGLATGIHVIETATGRLIHGGPGTHPAWHPTGAWLLFERVEDDGHDVTGADLMVLSTTDGSTRDLSATPGIIERQPSFSSDGERVAFLRDDHVVIARWREVAP